MAHNVYRYRDPVRPCRCDVCRNDHARRYREERQRRKDRRILVGGRWVADAPGVRHGCHTTYSNWLCRCVSCTVAHTEYVKRRRVSTTNREGDA